MNSVAVLPEASRYATRSASTPVVLADAGVANVNAQVDALIDTGVLRRLRPPAPRPRSRAVAARRARVEANLSASGETCPSLDVAACPPPAGRRFDTASRTRAPEAAAEKSGPRAAHESGGRSGSGIRVAAID